jgi:hypothetical protein
MNKNKIEIFQFYPGFFEIGFKDIALGVSNQFYELSTLG